MPNIYVYYSLERVHVDDNILFLFFPFMMPFMFIITRIHLLKSLGRSGHGSIWCDLSCLLFLRLSYQYMSKHQINFRDSIQNRKRLPSHTCNALITMVNIY